jgi:NUMOD3 motif
MEKAKSRTLTDYTERHHILPKCLGGSNKKENLVDLTAREHFIAHLLLAKLHPEKHGLVVAAYLMSKRKRVNSRTYSALKGEFSKSIRALQTGRTRSEETRAKMLISSRKGCVAAAEANRGRKRPERNAEWCKKISDSAKARTYKPRSEETKRKISIARLGQKLPRGSRSS